MPTRITRYEEAGEKTQIAIDYCARNKVVPRKSDDAHLPGDWEGVPSRKVMEGVLDEFGVKIGNGTGIYMWQRLGADNDLDAALDFLQQRHKELCDSEP